MFAQRVDTFRQTYRAYSFEKSGCGKTNLNDSGKVLLPPSTLQVMAGMSLVYPLLFWVQKYRDNTNVTHCGVLEFTAKEAECYMPPWMMQRLKIGEGDYVELRTVALPKASFIRFKPKSIEFFKIPNYKVVMERELRNYSAMTVGDVISIGFNSKEYELEVAECKPATRAVSIVETDVAVDFDGNSLPENQQAKAPSLIDLDDDEEDDDIIMPPQRVEKQESSDSEETFKPFSGVGRTLRDSNDTVRDKWKDEGWG
ncbi:ubiquitin fusion degradation protein, putative [Entamoeba invadens IP1]|uniref:Ubiquitin fusion degradation protein, putative n=2 Tax=Entamoeba invadens TaxID=33085 RepID=A0A0A1UDZ4_ENTIV|nr:ubiquitin fusion degradation protein, putative [Entamoeba invadens IP1]ELP91015.1 ubiquitin fusion degradation protein, putative [Entamoeba invadens IP1]BAN42436.1 ubiquitin fusion degradaton protein, putative [Entamoeba invadens]|eukprot:XP_004257786.1 ubiquitin fusion degradation protein, putative [Entamoeba invadens IP1]